MSQIYTARLTGLQNDLPHGVRIYPRTPDGRYQSAIEGATVVCTPRAGIEIGTLPVGTKIVLTLGGVNWTWLVVQQGLPSSMYDASCNGTWLLLEKIYENRAWNSSNVNDYANSSIHAYLNSTFFNLFSVAVRARIKQVKIPYRPGNGAGLDCNSGANGLSTKIFLLGVREVGVTTRDIETFAYDGEKLDYFYSGINAESNERRVALYLGTARGWMFRSPTLFPQDRGIRVAFTYDTGDINSGSPNQSYGVRPALVLPSTFLLKLTPNADGAWTPAEP